MGRYVIEECRKRGRGEVSGQEGFNNWIVLLVISDETEGEWRTKLRGVLALNCFCLEGQRSN